MARYRRGSRQSAVGSRLEVQRQQSIGTVKVYRERFFPVVSHLHDHAWTLAVFGTQAEAIAYAEGIWPGLIQWLSMADFNALMREER